MAARFQNWYKVLGISPSAPEAEIKVAFRAMAKQFHPDTTTMSNKELAANKFKEVNEAFTTLSKNRKEYDIQYKEVFGPINRTNFNSSQSNFGQQFSDRFKTTKDSKNYNQFYDEDSDSDGEFYDWDGKDFFSQYENAHKQARMKREAEANARRGGDFNRRDFYYDDESHEDLWRDFQERWKNHKKRNHWRNRAQDFDEDFDDEKAYYERSRTAASGSNGRGDRVYANREDTDGKNWRKMSTNGKKEAKNAKANENDKKASEGGASFVWVLASRFVSTSSHLQPPVLDPKNRAQGNKVEKPFFFKKGDIFEWLFDKGDRSRIYSVYKNATFEHTIQWDARKRDWVKPFSSFKGKKGGFNEGAAEDKGQSGERDKNGDKDQPPASPEGEQASQDKKDADNTDRKREKVFTKERKQKVKTDRAEAKKKNHSDNINEAKDDVKTDEK